MVGSQIQHWLRLSEFTFVGLTVATQIGLAGTFLWFDIGLDSQVVHLLCSSCHIVPGSAVILYDLLVLSALKNF